MDQNIENHLFVLLFDFKLKQSFKYWTMVNVCCLHEATWVKIHLTSLKTLDCFLVGTMVFSHTVHIFLHQYYKLSYVPSVFSDIYSNYLRLVSAALLFINYSD